jgi:hypothetical protein
MEELPLIDVHEIAIAAPRPAVWQALQARLARTPMLGRRGFPERSADAPERVALAGRHRFARYALLFELVDTGNGTLLRATTHARFSAGAGRLYRALVIGSGGHAWIVQRFLRRLRVAAEG